MNRLLILDQDAARYERLLCAARLGRLSLHATDDPQEARGRFKDCNLVFGEPALIAQFLPAASDLEWVQSSWSGLSPLLAPGMRRDYVLTGLKGVFGQIMAEYVLCYLLLHERRVLERVEAQRSHRWDTREPGTLRRKTALILGTGSIGSEIARFLRSFGMRTYGVNRSGSNPGPFEHVAVPTRLPALAADADYVISVLPHTPETTGLVDRAVLEAMGPEALFINVGRSNVVDAGVLLEALDRGVIGGAVLDVFDQEPLPPDHPLWEAKNTLITCHTSAISRPEDIAPVYIENYARFLKGEPLNYRVDFERGY